jgi:hypothetical protein
MMELGPQLNRFGALSSTQFLTYPILEDWCSDGHIPMHNFGVPWHSEIGHLSWEELGVPFATTQEAIFAFIQGQYALPNSCLAFGSVNLRLDTVEYYILSAHAPHLVIGTEDPTNNTQRPYCTLNAYTGYRVITQHFHLHTFVDTLALGNMYCPFVRDDTIREAQLGRRQMRQVQEYFCPPEFPRLELCKCKGTFDGWRSYDAHMRIHLQRSFIHELFHQEVMQLRSQRVILQHLLLRTTPIPNELIPNIIRRIWQ